MKTSEFVRKIVSVPVNLLHTYTKGYITLFLYPIFNILDVLSFGSFYFSSEIISDFQLQAAYSLLPDHYSLKHNSWAI